VDLQSKAQRELKITGAPQPSSLELLQKLQQRATPAKSKQIENNLKL
jgi:hypothetical protein